MKTKTIFITPLRFDDWKRQIYISSDNRYLVDVDGEVNDMTKSGEPLTPVHNTIITDLTLMHLEPLCVRSLHWLSHSPTDRGHREILGETVCFLNDLAEINENANDITAVSIRYHAKYCSLLSAFYGSRSNTASSFITGGSNFPVRRQEKLHRWADNKEAYLNEWRERAKKAIIKGFKPVKTIDSELERYRKELGTAEKQLEIFKASKKIMLSKKLPEVQKIEQLMALGLHEDTAIEFLSKGMEWFVIPYKSREIKRLKEMLAKFEKRAIASETGEGNKDYEYKGVRVVHNVGEDRLQLFFPDKPIDAIRYDLKRSAFRWSPSNGCWQSYLNSQQRDRAKRIIESIPSCDEDSRWAVEQRRDLALIKEVVDYASLIIRQLK